jgi:hypothetical protein
MLSLRLKFFSIKAIKVCHLTQIIVKNPKIENSFWIIGDLDFEIWMIFLENITFGINSVFLIYISSFFLSKWNFID